MDSGDTSPKAYSAASTTSWPEVAAGDHLWARQQGETQYAWLERCPDAPVRAAFALALRWIARYPDVGRDALMARLRSVDDANHESAVFELYLYAILSASGYSLELDPESPGGSMPDFLVSREGRPVCYVEATLDRGPEDFRKHSEAIYALLEACSRKVTELGYVVSVDGYRPGPSNPSARRLASFLNSWIRAARVVLGSRDDSQVPGAESTRRFTDRASGWEIELSLVAYPGRTSSAQRVWQSLGSGDCTYSTAVERLRRSVKDKVRQHRTADLPLIVAVSFNDFLTAPGEFEIVEALAGTSFYRVPTNGEQEVVQGRHSNGLWS